jgi:hypothetical protein
MRSSLFAMRISSWGIVGTFSVICAALLPSIDAAERLPATIEFNRDIRPILSDNCYQCHGPDKAKRKADLRLDTKAGVLGDRGGDHLVVPGNFAESELFQRLTSDDADLRMPPADSGRKLTGRQIELIRRWIERGAKWQKHWAFIPPKRPTVPRLSSRWPRNPIDSFIAARLEREGLTPSPEANKTTLIRRVTLDLTGLPPSPAEVDAFLADESPQAYEKVVERLLASPRYGERMAIRWLDAARYADTNGYQTDGPRHMWRWRDWVIEAFNMNMPFDQFTIEQLAGDMLPNATLEQKIATGFNRNHRGNAEGGIIPEEFLVEYVVDRVDTTATVWLGLTMRCARCHDHKYEPITQKEFYQVFAYFNNVPEKGKAVRNGNSPPMIKAPTPQQQTQIEELDRKLAAAEGEFKLLEPQVTAGQSAWEASLDTSQPVPWSISKGLVAHFALDGEPTYQVVDFVAAARRNSQPTDFAAPGKARESIGTPKFVDGEAAYVPGKIGQAGDFDGTRYIVAGDVAGYSELDAFSIAAWVYPKGDGAILSRMNDTAESAGYNLHLGAGKVQFNLVNRWLDDAVRVETLESLSPERWQHVMVTYAGSMRADGVKIYVNGKLQKLKVLLDELNNSFKSSEPLRIGSRGTRSPFHGYLDDVCIYRGELLAGEVEVVATTEAIHEIAAIAPEKRIRRQAHKIHTYFLEEQAAPSIRQARQRLLALRIQKKELWHSVSTTMVMQETAPRDTFVLLRGEYDKPGETVTTGVPACLSPMPKGVENNRLGFAKWLVDPSNPLTARVAANRSWQMHFGTGLVQTMEDFGSQGEQPSHPELLDWLAGEFIRLGWDMKAIQKKIVTSATYRQSSKVTPLQLRKDPKNRLLARGPRLRLPPEMIRDQALAISGLLVEKLGGPSVMPYQPAGLWKELSGKAYQQDHGEKLYRRSMYTYWKRTAAPPSMMTFDAAGRETCSVRQSRTNTPLQALTLMNDVTFVEASRVLAERMMVEGGATPKERIVLACRLAMARPPRPVELRVLLSGFHHHFDQYRKDREAAAELIGAGESVRNEKLDASELAAYTVVAGLIMNLDEVITIE